MIGHSRILRSLGTGAVGAMLVLLALPGCGGQDSPNAPAADAGSPTIPLDGVPALVTSLAPDGTPLAVTDTLGAYQISIDTTTMEATLAPLFRSAQAGDPTKFDAVGDSLIVDVTEFFAKNPCGDCLRVDGLGLNGVGDLLLTIGLRHPFDIPGALTDPDKRRFDLHIFDVAGVLISPATQDVVPDFSVNPGLLRNADGYTSQVNGVGLQYFPNLAADAHPYKILSLDNDPGNYDPAQDTGWIRLDEPKGHNVLPMGSPYVKTTYRLRLPNASSTLDFGYVLTAAYGFSAKGKGSSLGQRGLPRYFLPEFHRKEAWRVEASVQNNILVDTNAGSSAEVVVRAWDWQQGAPINSEPFDPATSPKAEVTRSSNIERIELQVPALMNSINPKTAADFTGSGQYNDPVETTFFVVNSNQASLGVHWGLVTVIDELDGTSEEPQWLLKRPTDTTPFPNFGAEAPIFRTYLPFIVPITNGNHPPVAQFTTTPFSTVEENTFTVSGCASADPDNGLGVFGDIVQYQWDFDWNRNPADFNPDLVSVACAINQVFNTPGDFTMGLKVVDGGTPALESNPVSLNYTILESGTPLVNIAAPSSGSSFPAGQYITFNGSAVDPDAGNGPAGVITDYAWDFNWDGDPSSFTEDVAPSSNPSVNHAFLSTGTYLVGLRARDGASPKKAGYASTQVIITASPAPPPTPVGNVTLALNRTASNGFSAGSYRPTSIDLAWADVPGEAEYVIYADYTPLGTGELLDDLVEVTTVPADTTTVNLPLPANLQLSACYVVRARSAINNVLSETANSEPAFIEIDGFEPGISDWHIGNEDPIASFAGNTLEPLKLNSGIGCVNTAFASGTVGFLQDFGSDSESRWTACVSPRLPDFPNIATQVQMVRVEAVHRGTGWPCNAISQAQYVFGIANALPMIDAGNSNTGTNSIGRSYGRTSPTPAQAGFKVTNTFIEGTDYNVRIGGTGPGAPCSATENDVEAKGLGPFAGAPMVVIPAAGGTTARRGFAWSTAVIGSVTQADWLFSAFDVTADYKITTGSLYRHAGFALASTANTTQTGILADLNFDDCAVIIY